MRRISIMGGLATVLLLAALPASGVVTGGCDGSVTIAGVTYGPDNDTADNPIVVPADKAGVVAGWEGSTSTPITDHTGSVGVEVGPVTLEIQSWGGANAENETSAEGTYALDSLPPFVKGLTGIYEVTATHSGTGGSCAGSVMVRLDGNAATSPVGAASIGGTLLAAAGLLAAGRGRAV